MTLTIYLNKEGGIEFDSNGRLKMIGVPNQIDQKEVKQRVAIRFLTQTRSNILHPTEGFDFLLLQNIDRGAEGYKATNEELIEQEAVVTLGQDGDVLVENREIIISPPVDRKYDIRVRYTIRGNYNEILEYQSSLPTF
jgi:hypothetical protein